MMNFSIVTFLLLTGISIDVVISYSILISFFIFASISNFNYLEGQDPRMTNVHSNRWDNVQLIVSFPLVVSWMGPLSV